MTSFYASILNEQAARTAIFAALHDAKVAAGGRTTMIQDEWVGLPAGFGETARRVVVETAAKYGVTPQQVGFLPEG